MVKWDDKNGRRRETGYHLNLPHIVSSNAITAVKSMVQRLDFTITGYAVLKNNSTKAQLLLSNMADSCLPTRHQYTYFYLYQKLSYMSKHEFQDSCHSHFENEIIQDVDPNLVMVVSTFIVWRGPRDKI